MEKSVPSALKRIRPDLLVSPDGMLPLKSNLPSYAVIHDINFYHRPGDLPGSASRYYNKYFPQFARRATRLGTVSQYSLNDIVASYGLDPGKIDLLYNGAADIFTPVSKEVVSKIRSRWSGGAPYFIFVGNLHPRKNIGRLLHAFDIFREKTSGPFKLLIAGERYFLSKEMDRVYHEMRHRKDVAFLGRLSQENLHQVVAAADALVFVPLFEGFGIPLLEAMNCDIPILASNTTSIPEVVGKAALLVDPLSVEEIANGMFRIQSDKAFCQKLVELGRIQRKQYSWEKTSSLLWSGIEKCLTTV
jgi:glycosyltransferase involved in cell wall biosynthesis